MSTVADFGKSSVFCHEAYAAAHRNVPMIYRKSLFEGMETNIDPVHYIITEQLREGAVPQS